MSYANKEIVIKRINELKNKPVYTYLEELDLIDINIDTNKQLLKESTSDIYFWDYQATIDTLVEVKRFIETQIIEYLKAKDCEYIKNSEKNENRLNAMMDEYHQTIKDLTIYKPSNYKGKIEILNQVFNVKGDK